MFRKFLSYLKSTQGATAIEYGLIAAGIAVAIVATVFLAGDELLALFNTVEEATLEGSQRGQ